MTRNMRVKPGARSNSRMRQVTGALQLRGNGSPSVRALGTLLTLVLIYFASMIVVRWNMVAAPTRKLLTAQIQALRNQIGDLKLAAGQNQPSLDNLLLMLGEAEEFISRKGLVGCWDVLFWSRGNEIAGWGLVHETEAHLSAFLSNEELQVSLSAESDLRKSTEVSGVAIANKIKESLASSQSTSANPATARWKSLLEGARGILSDRQFLATTSSRVRRATTAALAEAHPSRLFMHSSTQSATNEWV